MPESRVTLRLLTVCERLKLENRGRRLVGANHCESASAVISLFVNGLRHFFSAKVENGVVRRPGESDMSCNERLLAVHHV